MKKTGGMSRATLSKLAVSNSQFNFKKLNASGHTPVLDGGLHRYVSPRKKGLKAELFTKANGKT